MNAHVYTDTSRIHTQRRLAAIYTYIHTYMHILYYILIVYYILKYTAHVYSIYSYMYMTGALHHHSLVI